MATRTVVCFEGSESVLQRRYQGSGDPALSSPWDVALSADGTELYAAMSGVNQIWKFSTITGAGCVVSGTGAEANRDDASGSAAAWAQPSGVALSRSGCSLCALSAAASAPAGFVCICPPVMLQRPTTAGVHTQAVAFTGQIIQHPVLWEVWIEAGQAPGYLHCDHCCLVTVAPALQIDPANWKRQ